MDKLKVLNKRKIMALLKEGMILRYDTIHGKVYVQDKDWNKLGAVRFDTFLNVREGMKLVRLKGRSYTDDLYTIDTPCVGGKALCNSADETTA